MKLGIISPVKYLHSYSSQSTYHLVLAHMVEQSEPYRQFYRNRSNSGDFITLDNSSYEIGDDKYTPMQLIEIARSIGASEVMAPEHYLDSKTTVNKVANFVEQIKKRDTKIGVFATVHGKTIEDVVWCHDECAKLGVDTIGLSCRLDYQTDHHLVSPWTDYSRSPHGTFRRSYVRFNTYYRITQRKNYPKPKVYHLLGMNHPIELGFYKSEKAIRSCDSSAMFMCGWLDINLKDLMYTKPSVKLNFFLEEGLTQQQHLKILDNIEFMKGIADGHQPRKSTR